MSALEWDVEMRSAADCVLQAYIAETSQDGIDALLTRMEGVLEEDNGTIEEMSERFASPDGALPENLATGINRSCGDGVSDATDATIRPDASVDRARRLRLMTG
ncbi:hypothetical protein [Palleronia abyssalis]|uniref:Uncharacterized protein n=1 Tax=Palleronia abyssalis TaxID=1501240 RepID=A0A2R8BZ16_9RHOB|nr:hypothetical protein [Palleronia abyssalis]SPJ25353.1 hypothetical protein PAA8504_03204 [Palleronia abyssalis]